MQPRWSERICAYASGRFNPIKSTIDAEVQALINSLDKFKIYYLDKKELVVRTDSKAIVEFYKKISDHKPSRVRWLTLIDYITGIGIPVKIEHIDGKDNVLADTLSRLIQIITQEEHHPAEALLISAVEEALARPKPEVLKQVNIIMSQVFKWIAGRKTTQQVFMITLEDGLKKLKHEEIGPEPKF